MTTAEQRWLHRAKELAAGIQESFDAALEPADALVTSLDSHAKALLEESSWHGETLDTFLKDMLPLADCCASLETRLSCERQDDPQLAWQRLQLAGCVSTVSGQLIKALNASFKSGGTPPLETVRRLALSGSLPVLWWPRALRAAAEREVGQGKSPIEGSPPAMPPRGPELLLMASKAVAVATTLTSLLKYDGPHVDMLCSTLCNPTTMAPMLCNLAAVYACFARFPATFHEQSQEWHSLAGFVALLLNHPENAAVVEVIEGNVDMRKQLAAALQQYASHLLDVADPQDASWCEAWEQLLPALAGQVVWRAPAPEAAEILLTAQRSAAVARGLLRLLRALPPLDMPPKPYRQALDWAPIPLYTAQAAELAAAYSLKILMDSFSPAQLRQEPAARQVLQQGLGTLLALLPAALDILAAASGQATALGERRSGQAEPGDVLLAYFGALTFLLVIVMPVAIEAVNYDRRLELGPWLGLPPEVLTAAGEAALRLAGQAAALSEPLGQRPATASQPAGLFSVVDGDGAREGMQLAELILANLMLDARQEVSAAPEPGGVRPSLQAQLRLVRTASKFARAAVEPGAAQRASSGRGVPAEELLPFAGQLVDMAGRLLFFHADAEGAPRGRAPLTPVEKRALIGAALALIAARGQLPVKEQRPSYVQLCGLLAVPDLGGALLAQLGNALLTEQLVAGLVAAERDMGTTVTTPQEGPMSMIGMCLGATSRAAACNIRLGLMLLGGAAGEALEAAARQSLQGSAHARVGGNPWNGLLAMLARVAEVCIRGPGQAVAARLQALPQEGWEALRALRAAVDEGLAQHAQRQWRQEQLLLCAEAAATLACSNLACTNLGGGSEAGLKARHCSACRCVRYCSPACQRADWAAGHKAMCKRLQAMVRKAESE